ncbi:transcription antitermination protein NusB [Chroococcidiopsis sp. FACHB-1243]|uniref:transcription antitermination factor NusB n=1 Tax=Chroococcidiopsis sp. [FACHB-1243] TaxID=2692781 RepID=UPI0017806D6D|nr:transcription antitermination factor NusB [Chroococcidiopsis sp. [FACHB-1243]]MBD2308387.1 transcription antitermination protein NusB [Chroococcidiopsis sp. [FACHB-1243]]
MKARSIARELALLSLSQLPNSSEKLEAQQLSNLLVAAVRTLTTEVEDALETASGEVQRANDRLLTSETRANDVQTARAMLQDGIQLTQSAINRLATAMQLPEMIQSATAAEPNFDVRRYALTLVNTVNQNRAEIDEILEQALVDWQLNRLARIDRDILRIAVAEIEFLGFQDRVSVAIDEAVELAKRYSGDEGYKFINGVLRRVTDRLKQKEVGSRKSEVKSQQ